MAEYDKVIFIKHAVETLGYFSEQMAETFRKEGFAICFVDYEDLYESLEWVQRFIEPGRTLLVTFNYIGLSGEELFEDEGGKTIWETHGLLIFNILVDHPMYFHSKLVKEHANMHLFCVDREHVAYLRRFYPAFRADFLPLAGNLLLEVWQRDKNAQRDENVRQDENVQWQGAEMIPYENRQYDLIFTANYVPLAAFRERMRAQGEEYRIFYERIAEDLLEHPACSVDAVIEQHITEELGRLSPEELRGAMAGCAFLDMYARSYLRGEIVRGLAEHGVKVHLFGADWDKLPCAKPENLICNGKMISSAACARVTGDAKMALNVLPWFRDGAHDRIFTAMLQKTLVVTDSNGYLEETFEPGREMLSYQPKETGQLAELIQEYLADQKAAQEIAERGYEKAVARHTWENRAKTLLQLIDR